MVGSIGGADNGASDVVDRWRRAHDYSLHRGPVQQGCEVLHEPRRFPEYGEDCYATYFVDCHGIMIEVVTHTNG